MTSFVSFGVWVAVVSSRTQARGVDAAEKKPERSYLRQQRAPALVDIKTSPDDNDQAVSVPIVNENHLDLAFSSNSRRRQKAKSEDNLFATKAPRCSSSKAPKSAKSTKSPIITCTGHPSSSQVPSASPSSPQSQVPSDIPSDHPSSSPEPSSTPSAVPSSSEVPSQHPSARPSQTIYPSQSPSEYVDPRCKSSILPSSNFSNDCWTGNASYVTELCRANAANCCTGDRACSFVNATVCSNSCNGVQACDSIAEHAVVDASSCNGNSACQYLGQLNAGSVHVHSGSCNCLQACFKAAQLVVDGGVEIGNSSCNAYYACAFVGQQSPQGLSLGSYSCLSELSCARIVQAVHIGSYSCAGSFACQQVGYTNAELVSIGSQSCNPELACRFFAFASTTANNVSIGSDGACNVNASQCNGDILFGSGGSLDCWQGSGNYGANIPDGGRYC